MDLGYALVGRQVAEHGVLLTVGSTHGCKTERRTYVLKGHTENRVFQHPASFPSGCYMGILRSANDVSIALSELRRDHTTRVTIRVTFLGLTVFTFAF